MILCRKVLLVGWFLGGSMVVMYAHKYRQEKLRAIGLLDAYSLSPIS